MSAARRTASAAVKEPSVPTTIVSMRPLYAVALAPIRICAFVHKAAARCSRPRNVLVAGGKHRPRTVRRFVATGGGMRVRPILAGVVAGVLTGGFWLVPAAVSAGSAHADNTVHCAA